MRTNTHMLRGLRLTGLWWVVCLWSIAPEAQAQNDPRESDRRLIAALDSYIPHLMRQYGQPGLNIALARRGEVIWEEGFGYADVGRKIPMDPGTVMHSGSMGKTYTGTAVMQLVEQGVIGLHDPINKYLEDFQVVNPLGEREITFYDLLTHRSGLAGNTAGSQFDIPAPLGEHVREGYKKKHFEWYDWKALPRWATEVGEQFEYSNFGLATLGHLVAVTNPDGLNFTDYVQKHIMDPLGMTSSQYPPVQHPDYVRADIVERFSTGYAQFGPVYLPTPTVYFADHPAGTVVTTPGDHIRLLLAYSNEGTYNGYQLLQPATVRQMLTPQVEFGGGTSIGLIWFLNNVGAPNYYLHHAGAHMFGWYNDARAYPDQDFAVVIATNKWDMVRYDNPGQGEIHARIANFISQWLEHEEVNATRQEVPESWAWKTSYMIGLMMAERLGGFLGTPTPVTPEMVDHMANGAWVRSEGENGEALWDPEGFRAGMRDMMGVEMTRESIRAFLQSDRVRLAPEEIQILYSEIGGLIDFPVPLTLLR